MSVHREPLNPPAPGWSEGLLVRWRAAQDRARRGDCGDCGGAGLGFRHWAYPSECARAAETGR